ncbi:unnamed protein product [Brachionus calyciflorus]|uniref:Acyltransferase 3 domain-containing protein n=1 Tax=Brachionus calyciflorus TaxID=104777 RepID=A0A814H9J4_9BILA|nr:unnamed protein product [Brachionus calyciflorus]
MNAQNIDQKNFVYLDGYRGILALFVAISHSKTNNSRCELVDFIRSRHNHGLNGFFVLSAFLLTYHLIIDFKNTSKPIFFSTLKYFIKRLFRIYLVYFIVVTSISFGPKILGGPYEYSSWFDIISLKNTGSSHLWTMPIEIKYYFFIPIFSFIFARFEKYKLIILPISIFFTELDRRFNWMAKPDEIVFEKGHLLRVRFSIFFYGTIAAFTLHTIESYEKLINVIQNHRMVQILINLLSVVLIVYLVRFTHTFDHSSLTAVAMYWSIIILSMTLGHPNLLTNIFSNEFLRSCGKFSFGIYLLHPIFVQTSINLKLTKLQIDLTFSVIIKSYLASYLFFYIIEKNCMNLGNLCIKQIEKFFLSRNKIMNQEENSLPK